MHPLKKLVGQTAIYGLSSIVGRFLNWLLVPLYTYMFLPETYGIVTDIYAYISFLMIVLTYGMETGFFRFAESERDLVKVYSTTLFSLFISSIVFIILLFAFAQPLADLLKYSVHPEYIIWLALIVGLDAFTAIPFAKLRQQNRAVIFVVVKLINIFTNIGANLFFLVLCPKLIAQDPHSFIQNIYSPYIGVGYVFIANLIASVITLLVLIPELFSDFKREQIEPELLKKMLGFSLPLLIAGLAGMVNETLDRILLKYLIPASQRPLEQMGIYGANYKLSILMTIFIQTFRYAAEPFFFSYSKEEKGKHLYAQVMKYFIIFGLIIFLGVMFYLDILKYFIGEKFHSGLKIVPILLLANLFLGIIFNLSIWFKLTNLTRYGMYLAIFGAGVTIASNYFLIPLMGYMGSAWATLICYFLMMILSYYLGNKYYPVDYDLKTIGGYFLLAMGLYLASMILNANSLTLKLSLNSVLLIIFVGVVVYKENMLIFLSDKKNAKEI